MNLAAIASKAPADGMMGLAVAAETTAFAPSGSASPSRSEGTTPLGSAPVTPRQAGERADAVLPPPPPLPDYAVWTPSSYTGGGISAGEAAWALVQAVAPGGGTTAQNERCVSQEPTGTPAMFGRSGSASTTDSLLQGAAVRLRRLTQDEEGSSGLGRSSRGTPGEASTVPLHSDQLTGSWTGSESGQSHRSCAGSRADGCEPGPAVATIEATPKRMKVTKHADRQHKRERRRFERELKSVKSTLNKVDKWICEMPNASKRSKKSKKSTIKKRARAALNWWSKTRDREHDIAEKLMTLRTMIRGLRSTAEALDMGRNLDVLEQRRGAMQVAFAQNVRALRDNQAKAPAATDAVVPAAGIAQSAPPRSQGAASRSGNAPRVGEESGGWALMAREAAQVAAARHGDVSGAKPPLSPKHAS